MAVIPDDLEAESEVRVLLRADDLLAALPVGQRPLGLGVGWIYVNPAQPEQLFLYAGVFRGNQPPEKTYLFVFDRQSESVSLLKELDSDRSIFRFGSASAGNSRFLTFVTADNLEMFFIPTGPTNLSLEIYDLKRNHNKTYPISFSGYRSAGYDWSADGEWLVTAGEGMLRLIAPGYDYEQPILHNLAGCNSAVWVNR